MSHRSRLRDGILRRACPAAGVLGLGAALLSGIAATPASAIPIPPSTSSCTYNGSPVAVVASNTGGTSVTVSCTGLPDSTQLIVAQTSPLAGVISPSSSSPSEADLNTAVGVMTSPTGTLTATITVTASGGKHGFRAADRKGVCPPTQAQVNAGLTNCVVTVANLATATGLNFGNIIYPTEPSPNAPSLRIKPVKAFHIGPNGKVITAADVRNDCPTPVRALAHCWWGAALTGAPNAASGVPGLTVTINGTPTTNTLVVSPAVYCASGATAAACTGQPVGTLIGPHLNGTLVVPPTAKKGANAVAVLEPNTTPDPGNGPSNTVAALATFFLVH